MRGFMLAAVMAAGVAGQAEAVTITSTWYGQVDSPSGAAPILTISYLDPVVMSFPHPDPDWFTVARKTWSGLVTFSFTMDGAEYSGTGTSSGHIKIYDFVDNEQGDHAAYVETLTGFLTDGRAFRVSAQLSDYVSSWEEFAPIALSDEAVWSFGFLGYDTADSDVYIDGFLIRDPFGGVVHDISAPSPVPVPPAMAFLGAGVAMLMAGGRAAKRRPT